MLFCVTKGNMKFGLRFFCLPIHPMRIGNTMMNALLFNVLLLLITSVRPTSTPNPHPHTSPRAPHPAPSPSPGLRRAVLHARVRLVCAPHGGGCTADTRPRCGRTSMGLLVLVAWALGRSPG